MRAQTAAVALSLLVVNAPAEAQSQPATIPTVVALSMNLMEPMLGRPRYFNGRTPTDWPASIIPSQAKIVGGGTLGELPNFRFMSAVFEFSGRTKPDEVMRDLLTRAGYTATRTASLRAGMGGFMESESPASMVKYCKPSSIATFGPVDSTKSLLVISVIIAEGPMATQGCAPLDAQGQGGMESHFPVKLPPTSPPNGATHVGGGGSSWGGAGGESEMTLRTTMPADSVLFHYTTQLVAGGWKVEGPPGIAQGSAVQRFSFRQGSEDWVSALFVLATAGQCEVVVRFTRK